MNDKKLPFIAIGVLLLAGLIVLLGLCNWRKVHNRIQPVISHSTYAWGEMTSSESGVNMASKELTEVLKKDDATLKQKMELLINNAPSAYRIIISDGNGAVVIDTANGDDGILRQLTALQRFAVDDANFMLLDSRHLVSSRSIATESPRTVYIFRKTMINLTENDVQHYCKSRKSGSSLSVDKDKKNAPWSFSMWYPNP